MTTENYAEHIESLVSGYADALQSAEFQEGEPGAVLLHSGPEQHYFGDDRALPFQAWGHFLHWIPVNRPNQFVYFRPGEQPVYFQLVPSDFWYEQEIHLEAAWEEQFNVCRLSNLEELASTLKQYSKEDIAYLGEDGAVAKQLGLRESLINPPPLLSILDFRRAIKSPYELDQLRTANRLALLGHSAAKACFLDGGTEYEVHMAFLQATESLEDECPYTNIVALNEKAAILHYQFKRKLNREQGRVLLIDAGCRVRAYGSDITRTSISDGVHPTFRSLLTAMEELELALVAEVKPGMAYPALHASAMRRIAGVLRDHELCNASIEESLELQIPQLFMPHGVGHLLGIQVHDVGGHQSDRAGTLLPPPADSPALRNTRTMETDMVFTVEPGLYFIPLLLEAERDTARGKKLNWAHIDALYPCGGIRIEDNIRVTDEGSENLTRQFE